MEKFEVQPKYSKLEKRRNLGLIADALIRFVTVGTLLLGSPALDTGNNKDKSLAEYLETKKYGDIFLKYEREDIESSPVIGFVPSKERDITPDSINEYLQTLPRGWTRGEFKSILTASLGETLRVKMPVGTKVLAVAHYDGRIFFFPLASIGTEAYFILQTIAHELAHLNDPITDKDLSWQEKHGLFKKIKKRIQSNSRFNSSLFIKLEKSFKDGKIDINRLVTEYWAIICEQYMADPSRLSVEDFELVHWSVTKNEPDYNWREKLRKRVQIVNDYNNTTTN